MKTLAALLIAACSLAAQTNFNYNATGVSFDASWAADGGFHGTGCQGIFAFTAHGSAVSAWLYQTQAWSVSIDGAAYSTISGTGGSFNLVTVYTGLSDANHTVLMVPPSNTTAYLQDSPAFVVTSASAALSTFPAYSQPLTFPSTYLALGGSPAVDSLCGGTITRIWEGQGQSYGVQGGEASIRFTGTATSGNVSVWSYGGQVELALYQDGVQLATFTPSNTGYMAFYGPVQMGAGWSGLSGTHSWEIRNIGQSISAIQLPFTASIGVDLGGFALTTPPKWPQIGFVGDSIIQGNTGAVTDATQMYTFQLGLSASAGIRRTGTFGCEVSNATCPVAATVFTTTVPLFSYVVVEPGINDCESNLTVATFESDYVTYLASFATLMAANGTIYLQGITPNYSTCGATYLSTFLAAEQTVVSTYNGSPTNGVNAIYVDTEGLGCGSLARSACIPGNAAWFNGTSSASPDMLSGSSVHPSASGYAKMALAWYPILTQALYGCGKAVALEPNCNGVW